MCEVYKKFSKHRDCACSYKITKTCLRILFPHDTYRRVARMSEAYQAQRIFMRMLHAHIKKNSISYSGRFMELLETLLHTVLKIIC